MSCFGRLTLPPILARRASRTERPGAGSGRPDLKTGNNKQKARYNSNSISRKLKEPPQMTQTIRRLDPQDPQDQQRLADLKTRPDEGRVYLVTESPSKDDEEAFEDILDEKASTKATLDHLGRLIADQRIDVLHCDPHQSRVWVRGRIDGRLQRIGSLPTKNYAELVSHLKVQANLDLADDVCQTGALDWSFGNQNLPGQLQTVPTVNGEKLTFARRAETISDNFGSIGFWGSGRRQLEQALGQARGLVLFISHDRTARRLCLETAEAGLAQNQALSLASLVDQPSVKRDYQTPLKPEWGRTRQAWLKSQVSDDNDALIVDQLIGRTCCQLAVEAALNNKLVLSSLAGRDADDAIGALTSQGVDPHLLAAAQPLLVTVRLVRRLKPQPKPKRRPSPSEWLASPIWPRFGFDNQPDKVENLIDQAAQAATEIGGQLRKPARTEPADDDYQGQILLTETRPGRELINPPKPREPAKRAGQKSREPIDLKRDGLIKICLGLTSPAEVEPVVDNR